MNKIGIKPSIKEDESGIVALFVTLIIIIILSIIVIGFSQVARTEEANALNRQLSSEAFYAAESGVNDAYSQIVNSMDTPPFTIQSATANCVTGNPYVSTPLLDPAGTTPKYTCLLVDPDPPDITVTPGAGQPVIEPLNFSSDPTTVTLIWKNQSPPYTADNSTCNEFQAFTDNYPKFPPTGSWDAQCPSVIRVDFVPITGSYQESTLATAQRTFYLYPQAPASHGSSNTGSYSGFGAINNGQIIPVACNENVSCTFNINNLPATPNYYVRLQYVYGGPPAYTLCGNACDGSVTFTGDAAQIDSTGEAQGVLRRIQVDVSLTSSGSSTFNIVTPPSYAIETSSSLCKSLDLDVSNAATYIYIPHESPTDIFNLHGKPGSYVYQDASTEAAGTMAIDPCGPY